MSDDLRPRRSVLYMPGANERALEKAKGLAADAIIFDLEDAVAPDAKAEARDRVCAAAASGEYGRRELTIRVNGLDTEWHADDLARRRRGRAGRGRGAQGRLRRRRRRHREGPRGRPARRTTPRSGPWSRRRSPCSHAEEIAAASERLAVLVMGTNDLAKELHAEHVPGRQPLLTGLGLCLLAARAAGKVILDGVYNDIKDADGFEAECVQGRQLGFDGKTLIHPSQVEPGQRGVGAGEPRPSTTPGRSSPPSRRPSPRARASSPYNGRMIENLHVDNARRLIALAEAIAALEA